MRTARALALLLALAVHGLPQVRGEEAQRPLLARIADERGAGRAEAIAAWRALTALQRTKETRAALRSTDPALAFAGAVAASPWSLDLEELGLRSRAMERDPVAWFAPPDALADVADPQVGLASDDLPALWKALAARTSGLPRVDWSRTHRVLLPGQVPALMPLLETAGPEAFRALLRDLCNEAANEAGDERHADYLRAFRYGLLRLRAEAAGRARPRFADLAALPEKAGLPDAFVELARSVWGAGPKPFDALEPGSEADGAPGSEPVHVPSSWLARWALRLTPVEADAPFLVELIEGSAPWWTDVWAARRIASLGGRAGGHALNRVLQPGGGHERVFAAAERAALGDGKAWADIVREHERRGATWEESLVFEQARWVAAPVATREAAAIDVRAGAVLQGLSAENRWISERWLDVRGLEEHMEWIGARLLADAAPFRSDLWFVDEAPLGWLNPDRAAAFATRWATHTGRLELVPGSGFSVRDGQSFETVKRAVAKLAAMAPEAVLRLLKHWAAKSDDASVRRLALTLLARLGDAEFAPWMTSALPEVQTSMSGQSNLGVLGRVKSADMERLLREKVALSFPLVQAHAICALAVFYGCPQPLAEYLWAASVAQGDEAAKTWEEAKTLVLGKDPVGAVLLCTRLGPFELDFPGLDAGAFALSQDPRVLERLALWRDRREFGLHWVATACLAQQGDEGARAAWRAFLGAGRTFQLDQLSLHRLYTLGGDPAWVEDWIRRLDANCCLAEHAHGALKAVFPTLPVGYDPHGAGDVRRDVERWFERHRGTFVWSPILDGWIPGPRR